MARFRSLDGVRRGKSGWPMLKSRNVVFADRHSAPSVRFAGLAGTSIAVSTAEPKARLSNTRRQVIAIEVEGQIN
jgi:hypothetical protein